MTPWTVAHQIPLSMGFPSKNSGVGCHFLLLGLPDPGIKPASPVSPLLHWQADSLSLSHQESSYPMNIGSIVPQIWGVNISLVKSCHKPSPKSKGFPGGTSGKEPTSNSGYRRQPSIPVTRVWSLGREDPLGEGMATQSSVLTWRVLWTEELARLQSIGSHRVGHGWSDPSPHTQTSPGVRKHN